MSSASDVSPSSPSFSSAQAARRAARMSVARICGAPVRVYGARERTAWTVSASSVSARFAGLPVVGPATLRGPSRRRLERGRRRGRDAAGLAGGFPPVRRRQAGAMALRRTRRGGGGPPHGADLLFPERPRLGGPDRLAPDRFPGGADDPAAQDPGPEYRRWNRQGFQIVPPRRESHASGEADRARGTFLRAPPHKPRQRAVTQAPGSRVSSAVHQGPLSARRPRRPHGIPRRRPPRRSSRRGRPHPPPTGRPAARR